MTSAKDRRSPTRLVVIDDDASLVELVAGELRKRRYGVSGATSAAEGLQLVAAGDVDLLIADIQIPAFRSAELVEAMLDRHPGLLVILITGFADVDLAVQALRAGASDFVLEPFKLDTLLLAIERALRERVLRRELAKLCGELAPPAEHELVAHSAAMQRTLELASRACRSRAPLVIARSDHEMLVIDDVAAVRSRRPESVAALMGIAAEHKLSLAEVEAGYIKRVLVQTGNNVTRAAQILGIDRRTLYRKLAEAD